MKNKDRYFFFILSFCLAQLHGWAQDQNWPGLRDSVYSEILKEKRIIQVIVPKNSTPESKEKYEVLYVLDGEWYMEQIPFIYNFAANSGYAPRNIFVLIPNTYVDKENLRDRDFSPTRINNMPKLGGADNFHGFLKNELIPFVEKKYPANGRRSLVGSSFSGLFAVYAFVKDPGLFQSYVASDPNLDWDNNYVSQLAAKKLPDFSRVNTTLYVAGLTSTFGNMGIASMDSVLKEKAPPSIHWKCVAYDNETHYSVQHKAFYDGFRFSHFGYSTVPPQYHPMNGILQEGKPLKLLMLRDDPALRYTTDGTEPTPNSPVMSRQENISISAPAKLKIKAFSNRPEYAYELDGNFELGSPLPAGKKVKSSKSRLKYYFYEGDWNKMPPLGKLKPVKSGMVDETFSFTVLRGEKNSAYLIDGSIDIPEDAYYVFYAQSDNGSRVTVRNQVLFETDGVERDDQSFVLPLKKGIYPMRLEFFQKKGAGHIVFFIRRTKAENDRWWETQFFQL